MAVLVFVLGKSGSGKSYSMRNIPKNELAVVNVQGKILPFRDSGEIEMISTDDSKEIAGSEGKGGILEEYSKKYKIIVVDDFQYLMSNEFMRRAYERNWDKFTEIGRHAWDVVDKVRNLPADVIVYVMCHTDIDDEGTERLKTIGKLLDEKIFLEGMSTIVLKTHVSDGKYSFLTQTNGKDTVKSPADMFPSYAIDNDLYYVDQKIREYYGLGVTMTEEQLAEADETAANEDIKKPEKKRRGRQRKEQSKTQSMVPDEVLNSGIKEGEPEERDFDEVEKIPEETPARKRRKKKDNGFKPADGEDVPFETDDEPVEDKPAEETTAKRRRRRRQAE